MKIKCFGIFIITCHVLHVTCDPCQDHQSISDQSLLTNDTYTDGQECNFVPSSESPLWYRYTGTATGALATSCPERTACSGKEQIWINDTLASYFFGNKSVVACISTARKCCDQQSFLLMKNCKTFYVFQLRRPPTCFSHYCFNSSTVKMVEPITTTEKTTPDTTTLNIPTRKTTASSSVPTTETTTILTTTTTVVQTSKTTTPTTVVHTSTPTTPTTPTTVSQTSTSTTQASTTHMTTIHETIPTSISPNPAKLLTNSSLMCYSCSDMSQLELCDVVHRCKESEICFVERYWQYERQLFKSGCIGKEICHQEEESFQNIAGRCIQCCSEPFCNYQGCGDPGLPPKPHRGPICFDCQYESSPSDCTKITVCETGEFCSIQEVRWGELFRFKLGCSFGQCQQSPVLARSVPVCSVCCYDDYCNNNCTTSNDGHRDVIPIG